MTIREHKYKSYTIDDHPNKQKVYDWIRENWHDLGDHVFEEVEKSMKAVSSALDCDLVFTVSSVADRNESVKLNSRYSESEHELIATSTLAKITKFSGECYYTGVVYDCLLEQALEDWDIQKPISLKQLNDLLEPVVLSCVHNEVESLYEDEQIKNLCEANDYFFTLQGAHHV